MRITENMRRKDLKTRWGGSHASLKTKWFQFQVPPIMDLHSPLLDTEGGVAVLGGGNTGSGVHAGGSVSSGTPTQTRKPGLGLLSPAALASSFTAQFSSSPFSASSSPSSNNASTQESSSTTISSCQWTKILPADCNTVSNALSLPSERVKHCACFYKKSLYVFRWGNI